MSRFVTLDNNKIPAPVLLWEEQELAAPKVVGRFASLDDVPDAAELDVFRFEGPLTTARGEANEGHHPVVDADGAPLWPGARISFRVQTHHVNWTDGTGVFVKAHVGGGIQYVSDREMNVYDRDFIVARRREQFTATGGYQYDGPLKGCVALKKMLGDRYEHGQTEMFVRLAEDPRKACILEREAAPAPRSL